MKPTHKVPHSKVKRAAKNLETITDHIVQHGVYAAQKTADGYSVVNVFTQATLIDSLPTRYTAERASAYFNRKKKFNAAQKQQAVNSLVTITESLQFDIENYQRLCGKSENYYLYDLIAEKQHRIADLHKKIARLFSV